jgi:hypothetical protein
MARLKRLGRSLVPVDADAEAEVQRVPQGDVIDVKITKKRSHPHHRFFMALCRAAFEHLPPNMDGKFDNEKHFRYAVEVRTGYCHRDTIQFEDGMTEAQYKALMTVLRRKAQLDRAKGVYSWFVPDDNGIAIICPKSIAYEAADEIEFTDMTRKAVPLIEQITGISADDLCPDSESARWARSLKSV